MCKDLPGRPVFPHGVFSMRVSLAQTTTQNIGTDRKDRRQCSAAMATIRISYSYQASWRRRNLGASVSIEPGASAARRTQCQGPPS